MRSDTPQPRIPVLFKNGAGDWIMLGDSGEKFEVAMNGSPLANAMTALFNGKASPSETAPTGSTPQGNPSREDGIAPRAEGATTSPGAVLFKPRWSTENVSVGPDYIDGPNGIEIQCYGAWNVAEKLNKLYAPSAIGEIDSALAQIREECSVDDNGDPTRGEPERGWETGYSAGIRTVYRILKDRK